MTLQELIKRYGNNKTEMDSYKKQVDEDNKEIKNIMSTKGMDKAVGGGFTATYSVSVSESFDNDKLTEKLKQLWSKNGSMKNPYIKLVPMPDMDAIENAIYSGELNAKDLADCKVRKETPRLTIKKEAK